MSVLIVGAGAIGQWLGALLHAAGESVTLLARPRQLADLAGLPMPSVSQLAAGTSFEDVIFTVKAFQVEEAASQLAGAGLVLKRVWGFQNGMGSDEALAAHFPGLWFGAMTTTIPVYIENGRPQPGPRGGLAWATKHERFLAPGWLNRLGLPMTAVARVDSLKCSKLLLNVTCNSSCALLDMLPVEVVNHGPMFSFELACLREFLAVVKANRIPFVDLPNYKVTQMAALAYLPNFAIRSLLGGKITKARGQKPPSLLVDLRAGRAQSEVEVLNGAVVRLGEKSGIPTPGNRWLLENLRAVVADPSRWPRYRGQIDEVARQALQALKTK
ncbi:MAG: ketopantoate reductase C-terminal domain-containing protein [Vulcanimicrobiota bacterium]